MSKEMDAVLVQAQSSLAHSYETYRNLVEHPPMSLAREATESARQAVFAHAAVVQALAALRQTEVLEKIAERLPPPA